jgi:hypothetical protein
MTFQSPEQAAPITVTLSTAQFMSGLSRSTLLRRADNGDLKTALVGRRRLIYVDSLRRLLGLNDGEPTK